MIFPIPVRIFTGKESELAVLSVKIGFSNNSGYPLIGENKVSEKIENMNNNSFIFSMNFKKLVRSLAKNRFKKVFQIQIISPRLFGVRENLVYKNIYSSRSFY